MGKLLEEPAQASAGVLAAAAYPYLAGEGLFSDPEAAMEAMGLARQYLDRVLAELRGHGCTIVEVDGEQVLFATPDNWSDATENTIAAAAAAYLPDGVHLTYAGHYQALYARGPLYRIVTYDGPVPYTHAPTHDVTAEARFPFFTPAHRDMLSTERWAAVVAGAIARSNRGLATTEWTRSKRRGVLIDANQNGEGKTIASAYSVRPRPGAPVSTPLRWDEVDEDLDPLSFTMPVVLERVRKQGDLFEGVLTTRQRLTEALKSLGS